jgi:hypothetical protein
VAQNPETRTGYEEKWMRAKLPKTYEYFKKFEKVLWERQSSSVRALMEKGAFYSMFAVSDYTFAPFKVVWSEVGHDVGAAVVVSYESVHLDNKVVVPDHTVVAISFENEGEAHYLCGVLNSSPSQFIVIGYVVLHPSPHILKNIKIPKYNPENAVHKELARLSRQCHEKVAAGISVTDLEEQIDELAAELWGLSKEELKEIKDSLEEMR